MANKDYDENVGSFLTEDGNVQKVQGSPVAAGGPGFQPLGGATGPDEEVSFENPGQGGVAHPVHDAPRLPQVQRED